MRFSRLMTSASAILAFALITITGGCTGSPVNGNQSVQAPAAVQTTAQPEKPANQTAAQPEKTADPPAASQPAPTKPAPVLKPELGAAPAEGKTPEKKVKVAYLTFDDGPNTFFTGKVLDILAQKDVKATFMVVGRNAEMNPDLIKRILAEGHGLVNHSYSHDYNTIYKSPEAFVRDLDKSNEVLIPITGEPVMIFRAPGGPQKLGPAFWEKLKARGYISVGWNITSVDSDPHGVTPQQEYDSIVKDLDRVERLKRTPIILMHDGTQISSLEAKPGTPLAAYIKNRESTVAVLPEVIDLLKAKGYSFAVVDENTPPAW